LDGIIQILGIDKVVPAELFLGFGEGTIRGRDLPIADANGGRRLRGLERLAANVMLSSFGYCP
jgi:hypothetical protein